MKEKMTQDELRAVLEAHELWIRTGGEEGKRAFLGWADLSGMDLSDADLSGVEMGYADLTRANMRITRLDGAKLCHANLGWADLMYASLCDTDFTSAKLFKTNLRDTYISRARLSGTTGCIYLPNAFPSKYEELNSHVFGYYHEQPRILLDRHDKTVAEWEKCIDDIDEAYPADSKAWQLRRLAYDTCKKYLEIFYGEG